MAVIFASYIEGTNVTDMTDILNTFLAILHTGLFWFKSGTKCWKLTLLKSFFCCFPLIYTKKYKANHISFGDYVSFSMIFEFLKLQIAISGNADLFWRIVFGLKFEIVLFRLHNQTFFCWKIIKWTFIWCGTITILKKLHV